MSIENLSEDEKWARLDEVHDRLAARKVRHIIETAVLPRVGHMLRSALRGEPVIGCPHLVDAPDADARHQSLIDWLCEGVGLLCRDCSARHLADETTRHRDPRHEVCIRCGYRDNDDLHGLGARVLLRQPLMVTSEMLKTDEEITGVRKALGYVGQLATTPIAWVCSDHRDLFDSELTLHWPPLDIERKVTRLGGKPTTPKSKRGSGRRGKRKRR